MARGTERVGELGHIVASLLRQRVAELGIDGITVSRQTSISQPTMSRILRGERPVTTEELDLICAALGVTAADLITRAEGAVPDRQRPQPIPPGL